MGVLWGVFYEFFLEKNDRVISAPHRTSENLYKLQ